MCGIIGTASRNGLIDRRWLRSGRDLLRHRGPDDAGEWWSADKCVGFGHRRLAIIDLSAGGHQPMEDLLGECCIVFNGEIYNFADLRVELLAKGYNFRSHSDTEVILAAYREWGTDCLLRLNGMFAFALYDTRRRQVFMARDRAGEKPLFYSMTDGILRFSSELKALLADPAISRTIDPEALDCYLAMGFVPGERCIIQGVRKLPPAHALVFDLTNGHIHKWRYWHLPELSPITAHEDELESELAALLEDTVRRQLVADVPVGVLLSGGLDSSLVAVMAARVTSKVKTYTVRFPGYGQYDETEHARLIARHLGTDHVELEAEQSTVDLLPILASQFDEPMVDSSMIPTYLVTRLIREHCSVALGGDGGDELFGGYSHYNRLLWTKQNFGWLPNNLCASVARLAEVLLPVGFRGRTWLQGLETDWKRGLPTTATYFDRSMRQRLIGRPENWKLVAEDVRAQRVPKQSDFLQRLTRRDFENYMAEDILVKIDRASMLNSVELRSPLLDYRLVEFAFGKVPSYLKATVKRRKVLLKRLADRLLPPQFDQERKQGFSIPLASWLQSRPWRGFFHDVLLTPGHSPFCRKTVSKLLDCQDKGMANSERLFALVLFELWRREYRVAV